MSKDKKNIASEANSRRDFIKKTALGAGAVVGLSATSACTTTGALGDVLGNPLEETALENHDVIVVGAGVSGVYAATRLALVNTDAAQITASERATGKVVKPQKPRAGSPIESFLTATGKKTLDVKLYEYSGRVGGRLLSTPIEGVDGADSGPLRYAEFGGFRFDRQMKIVWETAQALGLSDEPFYYQDINVEENNIVNVRGDLYTNDNPSSDKVYNSYPNIGGLEKDIIESGFDLGNYITNQAFQSTLDDANPRIPLGTYKNIESITTGPVRPYPTISIQFKNSLTPGTGPLVTIPGGVNGWSFAYVRFHYAFNIGDWATVKEVSDTYEAAKQVAKIGGRPFYNWSWWALKRHYLTQEAVAYLEDSSGYNEEGNAGTVETNIDENFYFSVKSDGADLVGLTDYSSTDHFSPETAWRHITEGYSAIPQQLYGIFRKIDKYGITATGINTSGTAGLNKNAAVDVVKKQLIAFDKTTDTVGGQPQYKCLFYARQQGQKLAISGSEAIVLYTTNLAITKQGLPIGDPKLDAALKVLEQFTMVTCNFLILAMPRRSLELIVQNNFFFGSQGVQNALQNSVHNILAMRMFVAYPKPWWLSQPPYNQLPSANNPLVQSEFYPVGRTRTDLGLRQLYYWCYNKGSAGPGNNYADPNKPAVMLASYTSGDATRYWRALQEGQPFDNFSGSQTQQAHLYNQAAKVKGDLKIRNPQAGGPRHGSITMGVEAHRQIVTLHGMDANYDNLPLPYYVHYEDWSKDPWGAGWHSWRSGYSKQDNIPVLRRPLPTENVYIIGECYSNVQGWVQGALNAAEAMLQCNMGLPWASWLSVNGIWLGQGTEWVTASTGNPDPDPCLATNNTGLPPGN
ncbi:MAG: FAD-dependent oxidoreductase [Roseivirga sp.]|nr:FAD-dependent oxidoreductase [Roseivirga sp.]